MTRQPIPLTDDQIRTALTRQPGRQLTFTLADDLSSLVRVTPQRRRPLLALPWMDAGAAFGPSRARQTASVLLVVGLLLALVAAIAVVGAFLNRTSLPSNGLIAFGSERGGLFLIDPHTSELREIAPPWIANPSGPTDRTDLISWSPSGTRVAVVQAGVRSWAIEIRAMPSGDPIQRLEGPERPDYAEWFVLWSRDERRLIAAATVDGLPGLLDIDLATERISRLGPTDAKAWHPSLSPVGRHLAYLRTSGWFSDDAHLAVSDSSGRDETIVLATQPDGSRPEGVPSWSPDGQWLTVTMRSTAGQYAIARVPAAGGAAELITPWFDEFIAAVPAPDGRRTFLLRELRGSRSAEIHTMRPDGSDHRLLRSGACFNAAWAPDGSSIVFETGGCDPGSPAIELRSIEADGSNERILWSGDRRTMTRLSIGWQAIPRRP